MTFMRKFDEDFIDKTYMRVFNVNKDNETDSDDKVPYTHMSRISWVEAIKILKKESELKQ